MQLGLFYWKNLERASKEGKNRDTFHGKWGGGCVGVDTAMEEEV